MKKTITASLLTLFLIGFCFSLPSTQANAATCDTSLIRTSAFGQSGSHVKALQDCLILRGHSIPSGASGYYGIQTKNAVATFYAKELNLPAFGGQSFGPKAATLLKGTSTNTTAGAGFKKIENEAELKKYIEDAQSIRGGLFTTTVSTTVTASVNNYQDSTPSRVSDTNVQVSGIDEPDIVKTDGTTIYFSEKENYYTEENDNSEGITAVTAFPLSKLGIASDSIQERGEMLLVKDKKILIVMTLNSLVGYDISDPKKPVKKWTNKLKDNTRITTARLKGDSVYLITNTYIYNNMPCPFIPMTNGKTSLSIPCGDMYVPATPEPVNTTFSVFDIDPTTGSSRNNLTYLGNSYNTTISMFEDNLYVAYRMQSLEQEAMLDFYKTEIKDLVSTKTSARISEVIGYNISTRSKLNEISLALEKETSGKSESDRLKVLTELQNRTTNYMEKRQRDIDRTTIARISLSNLSFAAVGSISGHLLNQFSMDEYKGNMRVATTIGETWRGKSANDVYVLDSNLKTIGSILDLGLTERIYSTRFLGDKAYLVTFRQTDPFYVLDLSTPTSPKMVGELKIPGYSAYLEPLSENMILGVGREGGKVKMSLFDVTDPKKPVEKSKYTLNEPWTEVEGNHHAFLKDTKHNVFFIPGEKGGYVISYKNDSLSLKATVAAEDVMRALYIEDMLYIVAEKKITVLNEDTWKEVVTLKLP